MHKQCLNIFPITNHHIVIIIFHNLINRKQDHLTNPQQSHSCKCQSTFEITFHLFLRLKRKDNNITEQN